MLVPLKLRDGEITKPFKMNWDFTNMNWSLLYMDNNYSNSQLQMKGELKRIEE